MKYIIMCGGKYNGWSTPRWLTKINDEPIVERTIRLLRQNGVEDIAISSNHDCFDYIGVPILKHDNGYTCGYSTSCRTGYSWLSAFYFTEEPVCYIFGDVVFSPEAIKTIVETETDDIEFFASAKPFALSYPKSHAEPFAFKVVNTKHFKQAVEDTQIHYNCAHIKRCIAWELWQVIKGTKLGKIITNYTVINDYTCDIDSTNDVVNWKNLING